MQDATENCHYPDLVEEPMRLELNFTYPLEHVTELIVLGERMSSVAVDKFGVVGKKHLKRIIYLSNKEPTVSYNSSIGTVALFPLIKFQLLTMTLLPKKRSNPAKCRVSIGSWLQTLVKYCILQTLSVVKTTVSPSGIMNRWCRNHYSPIPASAVSTRYMQLFTSSNSDKMKLQEFAMLM